MFRARLVSVAMLAVAATLFAQTALAQDVVPARVDLSSVNFTPALLNASASGSPAVRLPDAEQIQMAPIVPLRPKLGGSSLLSSLYVSTALMQALDMHSTIRAFGAGATEGNPAMSGITGNRAAFIATKAAVATATIWATRRIAKKNKVAAVITLIAVNSAYAMIVSHNYNLARGR